MCAPTAMAAGGRVRYRVLVRWRWWVDKGSETVAECERAGQVMASLAEWQREPGVERVWWESRRANGTWRHEGRAAA